MSGVVDPESEFHPFHEQLEVRGIEVDVGMSMILQLVWDRGLETKSSCEGGGPTPSTQLAYIIFPAVEEAADFLIQCAHLTDYRIGERVALTVLHPPDDVNGVPEGKVTWMPELTVILAKAWGTAL